MRSGHQWAMMDLRRFPGDGFRNSLTLPSVGVASLIASLKRRVPNISGNFPSGGTSFSLQWKLGPLYFLGLESRPGSRMFYTRAAFRFPHFRRGNVSIFTSWSAQEWSAREACVRRFPHVLGRAGNVCPRGVVDPLFDFGARLRTSRPARRSHGRPPTCRRIRPRLSGAPLAQ